MLRYAPAEANHAASHDGGGDPGVPLDHGNGGGEGPRGYVRYPAIHGDTVVFTAEGDLWKVGIGAASRSG